MEEGLPAAGAALISVLSGGVAAAFVSAVAAHRTAMRAQFTAERAAALTRAIELTSALGNDAQARVKNLFSDTDEDTPNVLPPRSIVFDGFGEAERYAVEALVAAYGGEDTVSAQVVWDGAVEGLDLSVRRAHAAAAAATQEAKRDGLTRTFEPAIEFTTAEPLLSRELTSRQALVRLIGADLRSGRDLRLAARITSAVGMIARFAKAAVRRHHTA